MHSRCAAVAATAQTSNLPCHASPPRPAILLCGSHAHRRCGDPELFRALHMPSIGSERQTESGVFLVNRRRHWPVLEWLLWLNVEDDVTYKLACECKAGRQLELV